jgi:hypothetical protein
MAIPNLAGGYLTALMQMRKSADESEKRRQWEQDEANKRWQRNLGLQLGSQLLGFGLRQAGSAIDNDRTLDLATAKAGGDVYAGDRTDVDQGYADQLKALRPQESYGQHQQPAPRRERLGIDPAPTPALPRLAEKAAGANAPPAQKPTFTAPPGFHEPPLYGKTAVRAPRVPGGLAPPPGPEHLLPSPGNAESRGRIDHALQKYKDLSETHYLGAALNALPPDESKAMLDYLRSKRIGDWQQRPDDGAWYDRNEQEFDAGTMRHGTHGLEAPRNKWSAWEASQIGPGTSQEEYEKFLRDNPYQRTDWMPRSEPDGPTARRPRAGIIESAKAPASRAPTPPVRLATSGAPSPISTLEKAARGRSTVPIEPGQQPRSSGGLADAQAKRDRGMADIDDRRLSQIGRIAAEKNRLDAERMEALIAKAMRTDNPEVLRLTREKLQAQIDAANARQQKDLAQKGMSELDWRRKLSLINNSVTMQHNRFRQQYYKDGKPKKEMPYDLKLNERRVTGPGGETGVMLEIGLTERKSFQATPKGAAPTRKPPRRRPAAGAGDEAGPVDLDSFEFVSRSKTGTSDRRFQITADKRGLRILKKGLAQSKLSESQKTEILSTAREAVDLAAAGDSSATDKWKRAMAISAENTAKYTGGKAEFADAGSGKRSPRALEAAQRAYDAKVHKEETRARKDAMKTAIEEFGKRTVRGKTFLEDSGTKVRLPVIKRMLTSGRPPKLSPNASPTQKEIHALKLKVYKAFVGHKNRLLEEYKRSIPPVTQAPGDQGPSPQMVGLRDRIAAMDAPAWKKRQMFVQEAQRRRIG